MAARHLGREKQRRPSARESLRGIILGSHLADAIRRSNLRPGKTFRQLVVGLEPPVDQALARHK